MPRPRRRGATTTDADPVPRDSVDALLASWHERRPELDFDPVDVLARLARVRRHMEGELERVFADHDLTAPAFAVLATLSRLGDDGGVPQARLTEELGLSAAALDARVQELLVRGLLEQRPGGVALSATARALVDRAAPAHQDNERRLLSALSDEERKALTRLLRKLLVEFEGSRPCDGAAPGLGLTIAPAHVAADVRATLGLAPVTGLLVQAVERAGPAARAGLRTGDVLVRAGGRELRAAGDLYAATADGALALTIVRGEAETQLRLELPEPLPPAASPGRAAYAEHVL